MQCFGDEEKKCYKNICCMYVDDERCPNFNWLAPDRIKEKAKANKQEV